ncbi:MAG TPA: hypothetical protein VLA55_09155 [Ornithinibacter sp.]|nr:hypothetical protein [Ornithinibacter sp.]
MKVGVWVGGVDVLELCGVVLLMVGLAVGLVDGLTDGRSSSAASPCRQPAVTTTTATTRATRPGTTHFFERRPGLGIVIVDVMPTP